MERSSPFHLPVPARARPCPPRAHMSRQRAAPRRRARAQQHTAEHEDERSKAPSTHPDPITRAREEEGARLNSRVAVAGGVEGGVVPD
eukprot:563697-Rhodomonas_salina.1